MDAETKADKLKIVTELILRVKKDHHGTVVIRARKSPEELQDAIQGIYRLLMMNLHRFDEEKSSLNSFVYRIGTDYLSKAILKHTNGGKKEAKVYSLDQTTSEDNDEFIGSFWLATDISSINPEKLLEISEMCSNYLGLSETGQATPIRQKLVECIYDFKTDHRRMPSLNELKDLIGYDSTIPNLRRLLSLTKIKFYEKELPSGMKDCSICDIIKPLEEFVKSKAMKSGRASQCKECQNSKIRDKRRVKKEGLIGG